MIFVMFCDRQELAIRPQKPGGAICAFGFYKIRRKPTPKNPSAVLEFKFEYTPN